MNENESVSEVAPPPVLNGRRLQRAQDRARESIVHLGYRLHPVTLEIPKDHPTVLPMVTGKQRKERRLLRHRKVF